MNKAGDSSDRDWSYRELERIDAVCDAFERAWNEGLSPRIEDVLNQNTDLPRARLLNELVRLERNLRLGAGESPQLDEYCHRFPDDESAMTRIWRPGTESPPPDLPPTVSQYSTPDSSDIEPEQLGRYQILSRLGAGGFGVVYLAHDPERGHDVALKVPHRSLLQDPLRRAQILREAAIGKKLDHPHLVKTLGIEDLGENLLIVLQFVDGCNLSEWYNQNRPTPHQVAEMFVTVAQTLAYLHEKGYVHRDLKPGNILIDKDQQVFIVDFGMTLHEDEQRKHKGELAGTWAYMSPEQIRRQTQIVDGQSDLWSVGVIMYRMLTDRLPFGGPPPRHDSDDYSDYIRDLEKEIPDHDPRPPRMICPGLSRKLEEICLRCLEKRKRDRYQTGQDLADDLRLYLEKAAESPRSAVPQSTVRIVPKGGLRSFDASDAEFFLELLPGPRTSAGLPASLNFWRNRLTGAGGASAIDVGVIYGPSGCGKSSLVKAGLLPILEEKFVPLIIEATSEDTEVRLLKALRQAVPGLPANDSLVDICRRIGDRGAGGGRRILLVFDQFEQWLHAHPDLSQSQLLAGLRHCNGTRLQALFLVRDDFWMPLTRFMEQLEIPLQENNNTAAVDLFDRDHARKILMAFGRAYDRLPTEGELSTSQERFLSSAIDGLSEGGRIICVRLALFAEMMKDRPWTPEELTAVGGAKGIGVAFLEQKFGRHAPAAYRPHCQAVPKVLDRLLPPYGSELKGQMRTIDELREAAEYSSLRAFDDLIRILDSDLKLLTPIARDTPDGRLQSAKPSDIAEPPCYQLTHDYLVPSVREWLTTDLGRTRAGRAQLRLRERADDWNRHPEPRRLPSLLEWLSIWKYVPRRSWSPAQQGMMTTANRRVLTRAGGAAVIVIVFLAASWEWLGYSKGVAIRNELLSANTAEVPSIVARTLPVHRWVHRLLERSYNEEFGAETNLSQLDDKEFRRWLHLVLVLGQSDTGRLTGLIHALARIPPEDLGVVMKVLEPQRAALAADLGEQLARAAVSAPAEVLPLAAMLAWADPDDARLRSAAQVIVSQVRDARPTQFSQWLSHMKPITAILREPLLALWQLNPPPAGSMRTQLVEALSFLGANHLSTLVATVQDADPAEFALLIPQLQKMGKEARGSLVERIAAIQENSVRPVFAINGALPDTELLRRVESLEGRLSRFGGYALKVRQSDLMPLCRELSSFGFCPRSIRPWHGDDEQYASVTWYRDGREFRLVFDQTKANFQSAIEKNQHDHFQPLDVVYTTQPDSAGHESETWTGVWVRSAATDPTVVIEFDISEGAWQEREKELQGDGYRLTSGIERRDKMGQKWFTAIWLRLDRTAEDQRTGNIFVTPVRTFMETRSLENYGDVYPGFVQIDLRAVRVPEVITKPVEGPGVVAASEHPTGVQTAGLNFTGVWRSWTLDPVGSRQSSGETADEMKKNSVRYFDEGFFPTVIEPYTLEGTDERLFAAVWHRPVLPLMDAIRNARRTANLALAAAHCGFVKPLNDLLGDESTDRDSRTFVIERVAPSGYPAESLGAEMEQARSTIMRRSILLALGNYPSSSVPDSVVERVRSCASNEPEAAVRSAALWCLRSWSVNGESMDVNSPGTRDDNQNWYVNSEGHMMIILRPADFRIGSPDREADRSGSEFQYWRRISRRHSMGALPVTATQYRRFLDDTITKANLPEAYLEHLAARRNALNDVMWRTDCPQTGLHRVEAMMYCEWLSEREGIAKEDRCYPDIWEFIRKWKQSTSQLPPDYRPKDVLQRKGYRLPTEAEFEHACRGGGVQSRHFGDNEELHSAYCWSRANSFGRLQPVGFKKPNEFGFFDMLGNANQYCHDLYKPYSRPPAGFIRDDLDNLSDTRALTYIIRGGNYDSPPGELRSAKRFSITHSANDTTHGFRVARTEESLPVQRQGSAGM